MTEILHISDSSLGLSFPILSDTPEALIEKVREKHANSILFLVNVNYKTDNISRADNAGILFLKYLRLNHFNQHCVLYSFLNREQLMMQDPHNAIIFSEGVTFIRMPEDLSKVDYSELFKQKAPENLSIYFRGEIDFVKIRHSLANIYGLWFMFNIHNKFFPNEKLEESIFSDEFSNKLDFLQLDVSKYLLNIKKENTTKHKTIDKIESLKKIIRDKNPLILYIDDKANIGWGAFLKKVIYGNIGSDNRLQIDVPSKTNFDSPQSFDSYFASIKLKILNNGKFIDCLFLDIRLADETGDIDDLDYLSGIRLLRRIHQSFPSLPVIMFTASNKARSVIKTFEYGADGLWSKPGIDDLKDDQHYLDSYYELLTYVYNALNKYKSRTEKFIVNAQFQIESISESKSYPDLLKDVNIILSDTSFWCATGYQLVNNHKSARRLLNLSKNVHRKKFIVIDDVLDELYRHTKKNDQDLQKSAQFSLDTIMKYKEKGWIGTGYDDVENSIKLTTNYLKEAAKGGGFHIVSNVKKIHSYHIDKNQAKDELEKRKNAKQKSLHADDTFQMLITYYLEQNQNIIIITDDFNTNVPNIINTIGYKIDNNNWGIPSSYNKEQQVLKVLFNSNYCLIVQSSVLFKLCFSTPNDEISTINIPTQL